MLRMDMKTLQTKEPCKEGCGTMNESGDRLTDVFNGLPCWWNTVPSQRDTQADMGFNQTAQITAN